MNDDRLDVRDYNRKAWDTAAERGSEWTLPIDSGIVEAARRGEWAIILTPEKPVPRDWFPPLAGKDLLCLAGGGGQQGPTLAAAGANVTVLDNSPEQLARDRSVAERDRLNMTMVEGDMRDLSRFEGESFDIIVHPCSNLFIPDVRPVWLEAYRVLRPGGVLMAGFHNPTAFIFDQNLLDRGVMEVRHTLPYSDLISLPREELQEYIDDLQPLEFGHTLDDQIGGQISAGFVIIGFYEDKWSGTTLAEYMPTFIATLAKKPQENIAQ